MPVPLLALRPEGWGQGAQRAFTQAFGRFAAQGAGRRPAGGGAAIRRPGRFSAAALTQKPREGRHGQISARGRDPERGRAGADVERGFGGGPEAAAALSESPTPPARAGDPTEFIASDSGVFINTQWWRAASVYTSI